MTSVLNASQSSLQLSSLQLKGFRYKHRLDPHRDLRYLSTRGKMLEKWDNLNLSDLRGRANELINDLRQAKHQANLNVPASPAMVASFFKMFTCQRCGLCCTQTRDGIVLLPGEAERITRYLLINNMLGGSNIGLGTFRQRYIKKNGSLLRGNSEPCLFFEDTNPPSCQIYSVRPQVCQLFPVNTPAKNKNLYCNISCPAGAITAEKIIEYQAHVASLLTTSAP